ncbi:MAG TPA: TonB-dependent receptor [Novosphingobium sp.]|nr:TonB-dependent receptor [Novosphingobium sp.]
MKYLFLLTASLTVATPALAQGQKPLQAAEARCNPETDENCPHVPMLKEAPDDQITVTATGLWARRVQNGQSISVLTAEDLRSIQGADPVRVIERMPGVSLARSGPLGSQTALFVRGANSEQLLVMIDGIRVTDQASPSGGFDLGTLTTGGIGRIELLRGSNSLAWGSEAIGGVLAVTSDERTGLRGSFEYGAHDTLDAQLGGGLSGDNYGLGLSGGYTRSDGISAYAPGTEADGFRQWRIGGRGHLDLSDTVKIVAAGRYADSKIDFDGFPPPAYSFTDTPEYQTTRQGSGRLGLEYASTGLQLSGGVALSDTRRAYFDPTYGSAPNFETEGRSVHADLKGRTDLTDAVTLDFGADGDWSRFSTTFDSRQTARTIGGHALLRVRTGQLNLSGGVRIDDHDRFGTQWTFGANGSLGLTTGLRLRASYGQGFKAPTLSQLFGFGGNTALQPEESEAFDVGLEYATRDGSLKVGATLFRRDSTNLIDYVWPTGYFNVGRARAQGLELEGVAKVTPRFTVRAAYTWLEATNRITGTDLARRPRHTLSASADWTTPLGGLALGADVRLADDSFDDRGNFTRLDGYALVTVRASLPLGERVELFGRIENLADVQYQTVFGYGTYGRSGYAGIRVKW